MRLGGLLDDFIMRAWAAFCLLRRQIGQALHRANNQHFRGTEGKDEGFPGRLRGATGLNGAGTEEDGRPSLKSHPLAEPQSL